MMNELKNYLEEYIKSGMCQYEAPYIGKEDVEMILNIFNALDKACELLEEYSTYDDPTSKDEWMEELLNGD